MLDSAHPANKTSAKTAGGVPLFAQPFAPLEELPEAGPSHDALTDAPRSVRKSPRKAAADAALGATSGAVAAEERPARAANRRSIAKAAAPAPAAAALPPVGAAPSAEPPSDAAGPRLGKVALSAAIAAACEPLAPEHGRDDDWEKRTAALASLPGLLAQAAEAGCLDTAIEGLHVPVGTQISDLRSSVVRVACSTIRSLFAQHGAALSPLAVGIMPALLRNMYVSVKIIANTSSDTLQAVVGATPTAPVLATLVSWSSDSHHQTRRACLEGIGTILRAEAPTAVSAAQHGAILGVVKARTADADPLVRGAAAKTFWLVHSFCPDKADALLPTLDPAQQKLLKRNRP